MGGIESSLPYRVILVCGGRFALSKKKWGDCQVEVTAAHEVLMNANERGNADHRWYVHLEEDLHDEQGRPVKCVLRNDHHPNRTLCAGDVVSADNQEWTDLHRWRLEYNDEQMRTTDAVTVPFHLRNLGTGEYLSIDEKLKTVCMRPKKPGTFWQFYDAAGSTASFKVQFTFSSPTHSRSLSTLCLGHSSSKLGSKWIPMDGTLEEACSSLLTTSDGSRAWTSPDVFEQTGFQLCEDEHVADAPATLYGVFRALFGDNTAFRDRLIDGASPQVSPAIRDPDFMHIGTATGQCTASVPILGTRVYSEELRIALASDGGFDMLAVQVAGKMAIGWPVGDFLTEAMHLYRQKKDPEGGGAHPVLLSSKALATPGRHQQGALDGLKEKQGFYLSSLRGTIAESDDEVLRSRPGPAPLAGIPEDVQREPEARPRGLSKQISMGPKKPQVLPHRVNIIFGGLYAISKSVFSSAAEILDAPAVLTDAVDRNSGDCRWLLRVEGTDRDGRPARVIIRSDHLTNRSLRATRPVSFDGDAWCDEHRWRLEYDLDFAGVTDALTPPFHLRSLRSSRERWYLTIDEKAMELVITQERPRLLWQLFDAAGNTKSVKVVYCEVDPERELPSVPKGDSGASIPIEPRDQSTTPCCVPCFDGLFAKRPRSRKVTICDSLVTESL